MRTLGLTLVVLGLMIVATPALAQGSTSFTLEAHTEGSGGYFAIEGATARNPTLNVAPGEEITVTLKGVDDGVHNFCIAGGSCSEYVSAAGESVTFTFTAPASGTVEYFCQPHRAAGMKGTVSAGGAATTPPVDDGEKGAPGLGTVGAALALVGAAFVVGRRRF